MDDDFNTSLAISYLYELVKIINTTTDENKLKNIKSMFENVVEPILGLSFKKNVTSDSKDDELIKYIIELRNQARSEKRFDLSYNPQTIIENNSMKIYFYLINFIYL